MIRPDEKRSSTLAVTWRNMIALAIVVAVANIGFWAWRDGLAWGQGNRI